MNTPNELKYSKSHEWVKQISAGKVQIGLTDYAQDQLGDIVFVNLPEVSDSVITGEVFADVESVKAVSDVYSPVTGDVSAINETLLDSPEAINVDPYDAWFIEVENIKDTENLLTADEYIAFCKE